MRIAFKIRGNGRRTRRLGVTSSARRALVVFALLLSFTARAAGICPQYAQLNGKTFDLSQPDQLLGAFQHWDRDLVASYQAKPKGSDVPAALPTFSLWEQLANRVNLWRTGKEVREQAPATAQAMAEGGITASQGVRQVANGLASYHFANRFSQSVGQKRFEDIQDGWLQLFRGIGHGDVPFSEVNAFTKAYNDRVAALRSSPGGQYLADQPSVEKAGFDAFAMFMLSRIAGKKPPSMEAVYALSLLHPITDNALDSGANIGPSMKKLTALLEGKPVEAETDFEKIVFPLVNRILADFPPAEFPEVRATLLALQLEQLKSAKLQHENASDEVRLENTLRKGALTALLFGHLSFGKLDAGQTEYFYRAGSMLQLMDDLLDVSSDLKEGNQTVWTAAYRSKNGDLNDPMRRLMKAQKELEEKGPELLKNLPNKDEFLSSFNLAFRMFVYASVFDPAIAKGTRRTLGDKLPLPPDALKQVTYDILGDPSKLPENTKDAMKILDRGFLGGRYFGEGTEGQSQGKGIDIAGSNMNPLWWWVRATDWVHRNVNDSFTQGRGTPQWVPLVTLLYAADVMYQYGRAGGPMAVVPLIGGFSLMEVMKTNPRLGLWGALALIVGGHVSNSISQAYFSPTPQEVEEERRRRRIGERMREIEQQSQANPEAPASGSFR